MFDYVKLQAEIDATDYGLVTTSTLSPEMQRYIRERHALGVRELELQGEKPGRIPGTRSAANGYTRLLGIWFWPLRGLDPAICPLWVWMATLKNNPMVRLEDYAHLAQASQASA